MKQLLRNLTKAYLTFLAKSVVHRFRPRFIVITGTAGKTTTKRFIYSVLKRKYGDEVAESYGSMGTVIGLPLALLKIQPDWVDRNEVGPPVWQWPYWLAIATRRMITYWLGLELYPKVWVIELTADRPGDFALTTKYIKPEIGVVTNVGEGHLEYFGNQSSVAAEKGLLIEQLPKSGWAILNWHDPLVKKMADRTQAKVYWVKAVGLGFGPAAARLVGSVFGLSGHDIERGLQAVHLPAHRFDVLTGPNGSTVIDSTYNANPVSIMAVMSKAKRLKRRGRLIAVLGDMLELGPRSPAIHREVGQKVRKLADQLYTFGRQAKLMSGDYHGEGLGQMADYIVQHTQLGDTIVVKGSHGMHLDRLVEKLRATTAVNTAGHG